MARKKKILASNQNEDDNQNGCLTSVLYFIAGSFSVTGLIILIVFLHNLSSSYTIKGNNPIELDKTAQVGDFIGGLVGSIWAFAGVILFFIALTLQRKEFKAQRKELRLQRDEFKTQRKEFKVNRITNILYKQLSIIEEKAEKLKLSTGNINSSGFQAIIDFNINLSIFFSSKKDAKNLTTKEKDEFLNFLSFVNSRVLTNYTKSLKSSLEILIKLLEFDKNKNNNIDEDDIKQLSIIVYENFNLYENELFFNSYNSLLYFHIEMLKGEHDTSDMIISIFRSKTKSNYSMIDLMKKIKKYCNQNEKTDKT